jgi:hypothetical protein
VRSRADSIAHAIAKKIREGSYEPSAAIVFNIAKPTGGYRQVTVFSIPDSAVSLYLFKTLRGRNQHLFSAYSYAYRADRNAHYAIEHLYKHVKNRSRLYILEYDFAKYFDSISHKYLESTLDEHFRISPREKQLVKSFLTHKFALGMDDYAKRLFTVKDSGVPQGSSISLFLANVACALLDRKIEQTGAVFARYADDTAILCEGYDVANACAELMISHGEQSNTRINFKKSDGISILTQDPTPEMRSKPSFTFLGHEISSARVSVSERSARRIKQKVSAIIHRHLLLYPSKGMFSSRRVEPGGLDWDMVTCVNEIRRYMYGRVSERRLTRCLEEKSTKLVLMRSLLSFYPLVDDPSVFQELDGWLVNILQRAQTRRATLIGKSCAHYRIYSEAELLSGSWYTGALPNETKLPSFFSAWLYVRKCLNVYGMMRFPSPPYGY